MSESHHPTLSMIIPVYNYLIDVIEKFINGDKSDEESSTLTINNRKENHQTTLNKDIVLAAENAKAKLLKYYPTSDGRVFIISMSMY